MNTLIELYTLTFRQSTQYFEQESSRNEAFNDLEEDDRKWSKKGRAMMKIEDYIALPEFEGY